MSSRSALVGLCVVVSLASRASAQSGPPVRVAPGKFVSTSPNAYPPVVITPLPEQTAPRPPMSPIGSPKPLEFLGSPKPGQQLDYLGSAKPGRQLDYLGSPKPGRQLDLIGSPKPWRQLDLLGAPRPGRQLELIGAPRPPTMPPATSQQQTQR